MASGHFFRSCGRISRNLATALVATTLLMNIQGSASADITQAEAALAAGDHASAIGFLQPLATAGDGYASWKLAELYLAGHGGSEAEGLTLLQQAAAAGEPDAQARLGVIYAKGAGLSQDDVAAYQWLTLASRGAAPGQAQILAETNRTVVAQRLSPDQRAAAEAAASNAAARYQNPAAVAAISTEPVQQPEPVAAPEPIPAPETTAATTDLANSYRIQLASVRNPSEVDNEWSRLQRRIGAPLDGLRLHVQEADLGSQGIYHRLQAGPFASGAAAADACATVKAGGDDCLVVAP
jgi:TPR repeat protein